MNCFNMLMSSDTSMCKYRSILEATGNITFPNSSTIFLLMHIVDCKDIRNLISLCFRALSPL